MKRLVVIAFLALALPAGAAAPRILASQDLDPVWSPDASKIAFTRIERIGFSTVIYSTARKRSYYASTWRYKPLPSWSPDGRFIALQAGDGILVVHVDSEGNDFLTREPGKDFSPAWSPDGKRIAYLSTRGNAFGRLDLWTMSPRGDGDVELATNAIGVPVWAPDSLSIAFQRDDGIYVTEAGQERRLASIANPGPPAWSPDGNRVAYAASNRVWVVGASGKTAPQAISPVFRQISTPSWKPESDAVVYSRAGGLEYSTVAGQTTRMVAFPFSGGAAVAPSSGFVAYSGPRDGCPGHRAIRLYRHGTLTGTCAVVGTKGADSIEGAPGPDRILAGAGNDVVHANDGSRDVVDCGPGTDRVYADRTDRLRRCERVSR